jgi:hypothetical protein
VAPLDRCPERALPGLGVTTALQEIQPSAQALEDLGRRQDIGPAGRQLDRER